MAATVAENIAGSDYNVDFLCVKKILKDVEMYEQLEPDGNKLMVSRRLKDDGIIFSGGEECVDMESYVLLHIWHNIPTIKESSA